MPRETEELVVDLVRELAREVSGDRAADAVTATASLERDVGLGSLERVELLMRLEAAVSRELDDRFLLFDTPREIARAIPDAPELRGASAASVALPAPATSVRVDDVPTLVEALRRRATAEPRRVHVLLRSNGGFQRVTYSELWDGAARIAGSLSARGVKRGEPVAIMLPTSFDYLQSFMGVLAAGAVAVPLYPPVRLARLAEYMQRQSGILANAGARFLVAMPEAKPIAHSLHHAAPALETVVSVDALLDDAEPTTPAVGEATDVALIQYTSGSTGEPKGVVLSHANLLANIRAIVAGIQLAPTDAVVSWLPLYHDMGLIGTWLNAMVNGVPLTLMSPLSFLARPERWLWTIHEQRATLSPAPNFAYELCVRKIRDEVLTGLDLSSWRCASNGSEPVSVATLDRFARRFEPYGLRRNALFPVYGLAECAVALCFPPIGREPVVDVIEREPFTREGRAVPATSESVGPMSFVSTGRPLPGHEVRLVDDQGQVVDDRTVGRLQFRGPSCMSGYYRNPEATARAILADGWIDSGDLAYRSAAGDVASEELFITGRVKDLIIKAGRNLVPQEIEDVVGSIDGIRKGCVAAFGVPDEASGTERLIVLAESHADSEEERDRLGREAVAKVASEIGVPPDVVQIAPAGVVPKTSSGKLRRAAAREAYAANRTSAPSSASLRLRADIARGAAAQLARAAASRVFRTFQIAYLVTAWSIALLLLGPLILILAYALPAGRPVRILGRLVARIVLAISGCRVEVEGAEHLPRSGPVVLVANHTSYADTPVLLAALAIDLVFVAMTEILSWRAIGTFARRGRHLLVDRWHPQQGVADATSMEQHLREGEAILIFAEGGFASAHGLRPFRLGAFGAAVATGAPVVPIALRGSRELRPPGTRFPHPGRVHVWIGEPIQPTGHDWKAIVDLRNRTADAVAAHTGEPRLAAVAMRR
jgi:1-acyl-sn-glycerol-3-phosphate acyltransferase